MGTKNNPGDFDCYTNADPDEPMFILLGRDPLAPLLVEIWADVRAALVGGGPKIAEARNCARTMREWPVTKKLNHKIKPEESLYWEVVNAIVQSYLGAEAEKNGITTPDALTPSGVASTGQRGGRDT